MPNACLMFDDGVALLAMFVAWTCAPWTLLQRPGCWPNDQGTVVNLILESPAFLTNPTKHLKSSTIGAVPSTGIGWARTVTE